MAYKSLMIRYPEQPYNEIFAHFGYKGDDGQTWETPYEKLAQLAKDEDWNFRRAEFRRAGNNFPVLVGYLNYTFLRLQEQGKIVYSGDRACFNTGLQTPNEQDIFATFFRNKYATKRQQPDWVHYGFFDSYSSKLSECRPLPEIATYIENASHLVFDTTYDIEVNYEHLLRDNVDRLPEVLRDNRTLALASIQGSIDILKEKVQRNYKIAIPHWYRGRIQLLLPLNLTSEHEADVALVAEKDESNRLYRIKTVLPMGAAYMNARLITRPDREWLNP